MRVLVTGATGFLGQRVCNVLRRTPAQLVAWSREVNGSLLNCNQVQLQQALEGCTAVVHCAWAPTSTLNYSSNPDHAKWPSATLKLAEQVDANGAYLLALGSVFDRPDRDSPRTQSVYGESKVALRESVEERIQRGYRIGLLSPGYIFSPHDERPSVIRDFKRANASLSVVREPEASHDFVHVEDVVAAVIHAVRSEHVGVLEYGLGFKHTVSQLLRGLDRNDPPCDGSCVPCGEATAEASALPAATRSLTFFHGLASMPAPVMSTNAL